MLLQVLQGQLHLSVMLTTAPQAVGFGAWLCRHAGLVVGLQLEVAVDCCSKDIDTALQAVVQAVSTAAQANKVGTGLLELQPACRRRRPSLPSQGFTAADPLLGLGGCQTRSQSSQRPCSDTSF